MNDLVSRQALLDKFEPWLKVKDYNTGELNMLKAILYEIRFAPELSTNLAEVGTDCISKQAAIDAVRALSWSYMPEWRDNKIIEAVEQLPPIQPKRGRWKMGIDERFVECSECGLMTTRNELRGIAVFGKNEPNFCPNCGAKMEVTE